MRSLIPFEVCCDAETEASSESFPTLLPQTAWFSMIRKNRAIAPVQLGSKTFDVIRLLFYMFDVQSASVFYAAFMLL